MEIKIFNDDCIKKLKTIDSDFIDLIITDSPYNIGFDSSKETHIFEEAWDHKSLKDFNDFNLKWLTECYRVLKPNGNLWCFMGPTKIPEFFNTINQTKFFNQLKDWKVLYRQKGRGANHKLKSLSEDIIHLTKNEGFFKNDEKEYKTRILDWQKRLKVPLGWVINLDTAERVEYNGFGDIECFTQPFYLSKSQKQIHPCQKSVILLCKLILLYSKPNDIVLDCFMGSGSTGVAAFSCDRNFIGIEKDLKMFNKANKWLKKVQDNNFEMDKLIKTTKFRFGIKF